jgi:hypothetical protein
MIANVSSLNLTRCNATQGVCICDLIQAIVSLTIKESHFANNSGESGLCRPAGQGGSGWFFVRCDFFENRLSSGVLYTDLGEMRVNDCHFDSNFIDIGGQSGMTRYWIENSVFSASFPSTDFANLSNCTINSRQECREIRTRVYPTYSISVSVSISIKETQFSSRRKSYTQTATKSVSPSPSQTPTFLFSPSLLFMSWATFGYSTHFDCSTVFDRSTVFDWSAHFGHSAVFARSPTFGRSPVHRQSVIVGGSDGDSIPLIDSESIGRTSILLRSADGVAASNTASDESGSSGNAGLITGTIIGAIVVLAAIVFGVFHQVRKRNQVNSKSENDESVANDIQFVEDTMTSAPDETLVSYHDSFAYEGGSLGLSNLSTPISRDSIHVSLL